MVEQAGRTGRPRVIALLLPLLLSACGRGVLDPRGPVAVANRTILFNSLGIMLAIVVPVIVATLLFAWWFRSGNRRAQYRPDWAFSGQLEMVVWAVPAMVVILLGSIAWVGSHDLDPAKPLASPARPLEVEVVSLDWKWLFIYPGLGIATVNRLIVPAGTPVHFRLTSASVMNSFSCRSLAARSTRWPAWRPSSTWRRRAPAATPGCRPSIAARASPTCGFTVEAVAPAQFAAWAAAARGSGPVLDAAAYARLAQRSMNVAPRHLRPVRCRTCSTP